MILPQLESTTRARDSAFWTSINLQKLIEGINQAKECLAKEDLELVRDIERREMNLESDEEGEDEVEGSIAQTNLCLSPTKHLQLTETQEAAPLHLSPDRDMEAAVNQSKHFGETKQLSVPLDER